MKQLKSWLRDTVVATLLAFALLVLLCPPMLPCPLEGSSRPSLEAIVYLVSSIAVYWEWKRFGLSKVIRMLALAAVIWYVAIGILMIPGSVIIN